MIPTTYDGIFGLYGGDIPVDYLRALAWSESAMNPTARPAAGSATGLFQVLKPAQDDYERRNGFPGTDLRNPTDNTVIAVHLLRTIIDSYAAHGLEADWSDKNFIGLLTLGYKAGWSPVQGVAHLLTTTPRPWTVDRIIASAASEFPDSSIWARRDASFPSGHAGYMSDPTLGRAVAKVVANYFGGAGVASDESSAGQRLVGTISTAPPRAAQVQTSSGGGGLGFGLALAGFGLLGLAWASKRKR